MSESLKLQRMTLEEFKEKEARIHRDYEKKLDELARQYRESNLLVHIGGIVKSYDDQLIKITEIIPISKLSVKYSGQLLTKELTPYKKNRVITLSDYQIKEVLRDYE